PPLGTDLALPASTAERPDYRKGGSFIPVRYQDAPPEIPGANALWDGQCCSPSIFNFYSRQTHRAQLQKAWSIPRWSDGSPPAGRRRGRTSKGPRTNA